MSRVQSKCWSTRVHRALAPERERTDINKSPLHTNIAIKRPIGMFNSLLPVCQRSRGWEGGGGVDVGGPFSYPGSSIFCQWLWITSGGSRALGEITFAPDKPIDLQWSMEPKHVGSRGHRKSKLSKQSRAETFFFKITSICWFSRRPQSNISAWHRSNLNENRSYSEMYNNLLMHDLPFLTLIWYRTLLTVLTGVLPVTSSKGY